MRKSGTSGKERRLEPFPSCFPDFQIISCLREDGLWGMDRQGPGAGKSSLKPSLRLRASAGDMPSSSAAGAGRPPREEKTRRTVARYRRGRRHSDWRCYEVP